LNEQERELVKLLTALLFVYGQHMPAAQDELIKAHGTMTSTRNLIDALQTGRVRLIKGDGWKE
jgi:hypothetical protein